jgi:hypothetical protein
MTNYESTLFEGPSHNETIYKVRKSLGIGGNEQALTAWHPSHQLNTLDYSRMCSVISAYRLWDVMAMLDGSLPAPRIERQFFDIENIKFRVSVNTQY